MIPCLGRERREGKEKEGTKGGRGGKKGCYEPFTKRKKPQSQSVKKRKVDTFAKKKS